MTEREESFEMCGPKDHIPTTPSSVAIGIRVPDVRQAAEFYERIGFSHVMAVPDDHDKWLLCLLRYGSGSILLGALDHPRFPRTSSHQRVRTGPRGLRGRIDVAVPSLDATYAACVAAGCRVTAEPAQVAWRHRSFSCLDPFGYEWRFTEAARCPTFDQRAAVAGTAWS